VFIGLFIILVVLGTVGGLIIAIAATAGQLRRSRRDPPKVATPRRWIVVITLSAALALLVFGCVQFLISAYDRGRPAAAQITGTWTDSSGSTLRVRPDGTFTAAGLPADANDPAGDGKPRPGGGHGTWQITKGDGTWSTLFTLSGGAQFRLAVPSAYPPGHGSAAVFSYVFARYDAVNLWTFYRR
jgi:hypothetical protein